MAKCDSLKYLIKTSKKDTKKQQNKIYSFSKGNVCDVCLCPHDARMVAKVMYCGF